MNSMLSIILDSGMKYIKFVLIFIELTSPELFRLCYEQPDFGVPLGAISNLNKLMLSIFC